MSNQRDPLDTLEEEFAASQLDEGRRAGLAVGRSAGLEEGFRLGLEEGAKRGHELGYVHGYTSTCRQVLASSQRADARLLRKMDDLLAMVDTFPRSNAAAASDERLSAIRTKFKQILAKTSTPTRP